MNNPEPTTYDLPVSRLGSVPVTVSARGEGHPVLLLHGGGGPQTVGGFADLFADRHPARVLTPIHPGFGGTPRPPGLTSIRHLAALYVQLLDELGLDGVTLVGNSIGGWIAAEMGLLDSKRVSSVVLLDAVGIEVPGHPVADFFNLTMDDVMELSWHEPDKFRIDPSTMSEAQRAAMAGNRAALAVYAGRPSMVDSTLRERLAASTRPTLVLWGDSDRIVDTDYGRTLAAAIPGAGFEVLPKTGHLPQMETPDAVAARIWSFADRHAPGRPESR